MVIRLFKLLYNISELKNLTTNIKKVKHFRTNLIWGYFKRTILDNQKYITLKFLIFTTKLQI